MPRRDPVTGKFVSSDRAGKQKTVVASLASSIPAADLAGNLTIQTVTGDEAMLVDFTPILDNDEVFSLDAIQGRAFLAGPTTSTAEGEIRCEYGLTRDFGVRPGSINSSPYWGPQDRDSGIVDIQAGQHTDTSEFWTSQLAATPSHSDSVNGLAAGADIDRERIQWSWSGDGPQFDESDEVVVPHELTCDNISDHAIEFDVAVRFEGRVREV